MSSAGRLLVGVIGSLLVGALAVAMAYSYARNDGDDSLARPLRVGAPAPEFAVTALDGEELTLSGLRGQPVWLNFWATWCQPCRAEMPELVSVGQEVRARGVRLVAIDAGESPEEVRAFLERGKYQGLPAALDPDLRAAGAYRAFAFPIHVFIDSEGVVRDINAGPMSAAAMREATGKLR